MDQSDSRFRQIGKIMNPLRIALAHDDHERRLVDDSLSRQRMPVRSNETVFLQSLHVALDRKDGDLRRSAAQNLVGYGLRTGERRLKLYRLPVLLFPFRREAGKDRLFERFFHDRKAVKRDRDVAAFRGRRGQTTDGEQRHDERSSRKKRNTSGSTLPHANLNFG